MRQNHHCNYRVRGFTLIEVLTALAVGLIIILLLSQLLITNQRSLQTQIDLSNLESRMNRFAGIIRAEIHRANGNVSVPDDKHLVVHCQNATGQLIKHVYLVEVDALRLIDNENRKLAVIEGVKEMTVLHLLNGIDVKVTFRLNALEKTIHVFTSIK